jgi:hydrophobic/amphiphilic exporter-1 (mainly G- bacteria), HAE1 family
MKAIVRGSIGNAPALNIIMVAAIVVGLVCVRSLHRDTFPDFDLDVVMISVPYPGAAPEEVEEGICQKIEEAIRSVEGVKKVTSTAAEGMGSVNVELLSNVSNPDRVLNDIRSAVDRIPSFPEMAEDPEIRLAEMREPAIRVGVVGPDRRDEQSALDLRDVAEQVREDLLLLPEVSQVDLTGGREYQIDIEIDEDTLRSHGVSLGQLGDVVRRENHEMPGGTIRAKSQEVLVRGNNRRLTGEEIAELPLIAQPGGAVLRVKDLGLVRDEFVDTAAVSEIDGQPVLVLSIKRATTEDLLAMVDSVKEFVATAKVPEGYRLVTWADRSVEVRGRINLLLKNGIQGLIIVFLILAAFLELRLAFWIAVGIPFSLLASGAFLLFTGETLNMISMFAFIMALGIVVDDAIVVGENIYAHRQMGKSIRQAAFDGAVEVVPSVIASVSTTIIAFTPLLFVAGNMGKVVYLLPTVMISMLVVSLVESITILPCHLSHRDSLIFTLMDRVFFVFKWLVHLMRWINRIASSALAWFIERVYAPALGVAVANRSVFIAGCLSLFILSIGLVRAGVTPWVFFPKLDSFALQAAVTFPDGTPADVTDRWTKHIEDSFWRAAERLSLDDKPIAKTSYRSVGAQIGGRGHSAGPGAATAGGASHLGGVEIELVDASERDYHSDEIVALWREEVGRVPGVESLTFGGAAAGPGGAPIEFKLTANQQGIEHLDEVVEQCKAKLAEFPGVFDIVDDSLPGKFEFRLRVKPEAMAMGVRAADLAETVRATYYGQEVMRLQRGRHEVKLMVRYPREDRHSLAQFDDIRVRTVNGAEQPLTELAEVEVVRGYSKINRLDQLRSVTIKADVNESVGNASQVVRALKAEIMPELLRDRPGVRVRWEGQQEQQQESMQSMMFGFAIAVLAMFVLLAFEFKSYAQPLIILVIIPFGMIGAVAGHTILGLPLTIFSLFGVIALSGIVINDSIVLVDFVNNLRKSGLPTMEAVQQAGRRRFRPVMLTTITTVGGLTPILLETSFQAQMLIPMATSIAFGEIFATVLVLFLVPVLYSLYADGCRLLGVETSHGDDLSVGENDVPRRPELPLPDEIDMTPSGVSI